MCASRTSESVNVSTGSMQGRSSVQDVPSRRATTERDGEADHRHDAGTQQPVPDDYHEMSKKPFGTSRSCGFQPTSSS